MDCWGGEEEQARFEFHRLKLKHKDDGGGGGGEERASTTMAPGPARRPDMELF